MNIRKLYPLDAGAILEGRELEHVAYSVLCEENEFYINDSHVIYMAKKGSENARKIGSSDDFREFLYKKYNKKTDPRKVVYPVRIDNGFGPTIVLFMDSQEAADYAAETDHSSLLPPSRMWEEETLKYSIMCKDKDGNFSDVNMTNDPAVTPFADFLLRNNIKIKKIAERFGIPYRTVQNWKYGINKCPDYVLNMMQELIGNEKNRA